MDHGKAINAADDFVTMYKQRTQISSMSNHIHSLIHAVFSVDVYKLTNIYELKYLQGPIQHHKCWLTLIDKPKEDLLIIKINHIEDSIF